MRLRFLLGPAGSGKTFRCLAEIRAALTASAEGAPLVLLAPKQATFQLERQLLADPALPGFTRLHIASFERLAGFILDTWDPPRPRLLSEEGRVMVLRALLARHRDRLKLFRASARLPGFARQLSELLREFQQYGLQPAALEKLATWLGPDNALADKLHDFGLLLRGYDDWLRAEEVKDADQLLDAATEAILKGAGPGPEARPGFRLAGLWVDGFAELTPQQMELLVALVPATESVTLAFCIDAAGRESESPLSTWAMVGQTFHGCLNRLKAVSGAEPLVEHLPRRPDSGRFAGQPMLQHLEAHWANPRPYREPADDARGMAKALRVVACANPEAEAVFAAREIRRFVREDGGRFRDIAVLVRSLEGYHDVLRRTFTRYQIPYFLDRREPVAHHPLAELTRSAVRLVVFGWRHEDWFGALKTGLVHWDEAGIDALENEALARGWEGTFWLEPFPEPRPTAGGKVRERTGQSSGSRDSFPRAGDAAIPERLDRLRRELVAPFQQFAARLKRPRERPTGAQLADALAALWETLNVAETLEAWSARRGADRGTELPDPTHATVWEQMQGWLSNLVLAFAEASLPLVEWLPILEAGLSGLTVGAIPPVLDQVLIGTTDRSRNPDLRVTLLLGLNEAVFPATPAMDPLLTEGERDQLAQQEVRLGPTPRQRLGREHYYGYIAWTRARQRVWGTFSQRDADETPLNPSPFITRLQRLFLALAIESAPPRWPWPASEHASELVAPWLGDELPKGESSPVLARLEALPGLGELRQRVNAFAEGCAVTTLAPGLADRLYGSTLKTSVSRLEQFAACPFRFFVHSGLRAEERRRFELDAREQGSFQHEVLAEFHRRLRAEGKEWRDLTPGAARECIGRIGVELAPTFREGLMRAAEGNPLAARSLTAALQDFIETLIGWMPQYGFDPRAVELGFGGPEDPLPAWVLDLGGGRQLTLRGKIDRVDLAPGGAADEALCVVLDYKSSRRQLDPALLAGGVQLQLPAYLGCLRRLANPQPEFGVTRLVPAGVFYVNLRGQYASSATRRDAFTDRDAARQKAYQHTGRFDLAVLRRLDQRPGAKTGTQFKYRLKNNGTPYANDRDPLTAEAFAGFLDAVETQLIELGRGIFRGSVKVDPYRAGRQKACDHCDYQSVCRIDPWMHVYRALSISTRESEAKD